MLSTKNAEFVISRDGNVWQVMQTSQHSCSGMSHYRKCIQTACHLVLLACLPLHVWKYAQAEESVRIQYGKKNQQHAARHRL